MYGIVEPILIVDDDKMVQETILLAFENDPDKKCFVADSAQMALQIIEENDIFVVITDIKMPELDGIELCKIISQMESSISLIAMTGYKDVEKTPDLINIGVSYFLEKPFKLEELKKLTDKLVSDQILQELEQRLIRNVAKHENHDLKYRELSQKEKINFLMQLANKD